MTPSYLFCPIFSDAMMYCRGSNWCGCDLLLLRCYTLQPDIVHYVLLLAIRRTSLSAHAHTIPTHCPLSFVLVPSIRASPSHSVPSLMGGNWRPADLEVVWLLWPSSQWVWTPITAWGQSVTHPPDSGSIALMRGLSAGCCISTAMTHSQFHQVLLSHTCMLALPCSCM